MFDFHGGCDVVLVKNDCVEVHLRLERSAEARWSTIQSVAVKIGSDTIEAKSDLTLATSEWRYYFNDPTLIAPYLPSDTKPANDVGGWPLTIGSDKIDLDHPSGAGQIKIKRLGTNRGVFFGFSVTVEGGTADFDTCFNDSVGMCSKFDMSDQGFYNRAGVAMEDEGRFKNNFGQEWQVLPSEAILSDISFDPVGDYHYAYPQLCYGENPTPTIEEPKSCQDVDAGRPPDATAEGACAYCHTLWSDNIICNCDFDAGLIGCENVDIIYTPDNMDFLNPDPTDKEPTPEPSDSPSISLEPSTSSSTASPTATTTGNPTVSPTASPTATVTGNPTVSPTASPTATVTGNPTVSPTPSPTATTTGNPTVSPTASPTATTTENPTVSPTQSIPSAPPCSSDEDILKVELKTDNSGDRITWGLEKQNDMGDFEEYFCLGELVGTPYGDNAEYTEEYCILKNKW